MLKTDNLLSGIRYSGFSSVCRILNYRDKYPDINILTWYLILSDYDGLNGWSFHMPLSDQNFPSLQFLNLFVDCASITCYGSEFQLSQTRILKNVFSARCYAESGIATANCPSVCLSFCLSVCPFVTLRYRDHRSWISSKIISPLVSLGCSLFADLNIVDLLQVNTLEHPAMLVGIWEGYRKSGFRQSVYIRML